MSALTEADALVLAEIIERPQDGIAVLADRLGMAPLDVIESLTRLALRAPDPEA